MLPKYLTQKEDTPQKQGFKHEKVAAKAIVKQTIASGRFFEKGDLSVVDSDDDYAVDVKKVVKQKSFNLSLKNIDKFYKEVAPKTPVFMIYIGDYVVKAIVERQ